MNCEGFVWENRCGTPKGDPKLQGGRAHVGDVDVVRTCVIPRLEKGRGPQGWKQLHVEAFPRDDDAAFAETLGLAGRRAEKLLAMQ